MSDFLNDFIRVTPDNRCPVCGRGDWCALHKSGKLALCARAESAIPYGEAGWLHPADGTPIDIPQSEHDYLSSQEVANVARRCNCWGGEPPRNAAPRLGVCPSSLGALGMGYDRNSDALAFPQVDATSRIVGIRYRGWNGRKWSLKGGRVGLFIPRPWLLNQRLVYLPEGPTDCAAILSMGFYAIGRPNCSGGRQMLRQWSDAHPECKFVVVADNDKPDRYGRRPGIDGAQRMAQSLGQERVFGILKPTRHKDIREFVQALGGPAFACDSFASTYYFESIPLCRPLPSLPLQPVPA